MQEHVEIRLARIEEGIIFSRSKADERHQDLMRAVSNITQKVEIHDKAVMLIDRDRKWVYGLCAFVGGIASTAVKFLFHS